MREPAHVRDPVIRGSPDSSTPLVSLRGVSKRYGDLLANDGIDLADRARRDPRASRRERGRQVDPGQDPVRRHRAERRRDPLAGPSGPHRLAGRGASARHRDGVPALLAVRRAHRRRERRRRARGRVDAEARPRPPPRGEPRLRARARARPGRLDALGRRAPAHRDRPLPSGRPEAPDPRRADLRADARRKRRSCSERWSAWPARAAPSSTSRTGSTRCAGFAAPRRSSAPAGSWRRSTRGSDRRARSRR